jgi:hypothetical protein
MAKFAREMGVIAKARREGNLAKRPCTCRSLRRDRPLKIQRKNSGSGNKCLRAIGTTASELGSFCQKSHLIAGFFVCFCDSTDLSSG